MNETALNPVTMHLDIYGEGEFDGKDKPFPSERINDALSQNILFRCYDQAMSVDELSQVCGIPAFYVEDCVQRLLDRAALIRHGANKYRTDFIIFVDKHGDYLQANANKLLAPLFERLVDALRAIAEECAKLDFYRAQRSEDDLFYLYGVMAFAYASRYYSPLTASPIPMNLDGHRWRYIASMETDWRRRGGVSVQTCTNNMSRRMKHTVYQFGTLRSRPMMYDNYINACTDLLEKNACDDVDAVTLATRDGYLVRQENGSFFVTTPALNRAQKQTFDEIAARHLAPLMPDYAATCQKLATGYKKLFPEHLQSDAERLSANLFLGLYANVAAYAQSSGRVKAPSDDFICDVLLPYDL